MVHKDRRENLARKDPKVRQVKMVPELIFLVHSTILQNYQPPAIMAMLTSSTENYTSGTDLLGRTSATYKDRQALMARKDQQVRKEKPDHKDRQVRMARKDQQDRKEKPDHKDRQVQMVHKDRRENLARKDPKVRQVKMVPELIFLVHSTILQNYQPPAIMAMPTSSTENYTSGTDLLGRTSATYKDLQALMARKDQQVRKEKPDHKDRQALMERKDQDQQVRKEKPDHKAQALMERKDRTTRRQPGRDQARTRQE
jgi:hypothetical protein